MKRISLIARWIIGSILVLIGIYPLVFSRPAEIEVQGTLILLVGLLIQPITEKLIAKCKWYLLVVIFLLIAFNPSPSEFEYYAKGVYAKGKESFRRETNFLICSIYEYESKDEYQKYFAILGNFYPIDD